MELEQYACYVIADGLNDISDAKSASLAIQTAIVAFQENPSMRKGTVLSYLKAANKALKASDSKERLKASLTIVVTDYVKVRYAYAGNTRFRLYRNGTLREETKDMSLGQEMGRQEALSADVLSKHEERNNLYTYVGQEKGFSPFVSKKIKLETGDILALYTRGIWENIDNGELDDVFTEAKEVPQESLDQLEDLLLSRQPEHLDNYTFAAIFVNKVFLDPNRKRRIKKIIIITVIVVVVAAIISLVVWLLYRQRQNRIEDLAVKYESTLDYIEDNNYVRAGEECKEALKVAEKLKDKEKIAEISSYQKLIEAVNKADDTYSQEKYEDAQTDYLTAKERSRFADHVGDTYIENKLSGIADYLSVYDYIQLGDTLSIKGDYESAEEKYLLAKSLSTSIYFDEGRKEALSALDLLYEDMAKVKEEQSAKVQETVTAETGAAELVSKGDKAFEEGDFEGAKVYYAMALEKYKKLEDAENAESVNTKLKACVKKSTEKDDKLALAEEYMEAGKNLEAEGMLAEAKKQYMLASEIYTELEEEDKIRQTENRLEMTDVDLEEEKQLKQEELQEAQKEAAEAAAAGTVSGNSAG